MIHHRIASLCLAALAVAGARPDLAAQARPCPGGPDDGEGISVTASFAAHPTRVAAVLDSVFDEAGYRVEASPAGAGDWRTAPRHTFVDGLRPEAVEGVEHPGTLVAARTEVDGDSTRLVVFAHTICRTLRAGAEDEGLETALEVLSSSALVADVEERMEALAAAGVELATPVERAARGPDLTLRGPEEVAGFRVIGRHDFEDPAAGVNLRYGREDGRYVDVYVYPGIPAGCDAACAAGGVDEEVDGFVSDFPMLVERGYYQRLELRRDETLPPPAGGPWLAGRHLTMDATLRGEAAESHYYLFAFPAYKLKVRATFPPSAAMGPAVQAFVDALLPAMVVER